LLLELVEVQMAGKRTMGAEEFLRNRRAVEQVR